MLCGVHPLINALPLPGDKTMRFWLERLGFGCGITPDESCIASLSAFFLPSSSFLLKRDSSGKHLAVVLGGEIN